jgi:hypothetical protein
VSNLNASNITSGTVNAARLNITGDATFASGYDPTSKTAAVGGTYDSAASGARVRIFPSSTTYGIQVTDGTNDVFAVHVSGAGDPGTGDVIIGSVAGGKYAKWDNSAATLTVQGLIQTAASGQRMILDNTTNTLLFNDASEVNRVKIDTDAGYGYLTVKGDRFAAFGDGYTAMWGGQVNLNKDASSTAAVFNITKGSGGTLKFSIDANGNITTVGTVDGVDVAAHSARHENGGADEISVAGLSGALADAQPSTNHNLIDTTHHPVSGLTSGHFLKATGTTTYGFAAHGLTYSDVGATAAAHAGSAATSAHTGLGTIAAYATGDFVTTSTGTDTSITVVVGVRFYIESGIRYMEKETQTINVTNGQITGYGNVSAWTSCGSDA